MDKTGLSGRSVITWTAIMFTALALAYFIGAVVVPVWQVRAGLHARLRRELTEEEIVEQLGGPKQAAAKMSVYMKMPGWVQENEIVGRHAVIELCKRLGPAGSSIIPDLVRYPRDPDELFLMTGVLVDLPPAPDAFVPQVASALRHEYAGVRHLAAAELSKRGVNAESAIPALIAALSDEAPRVRQCSVLALGQLGPKARPALPRLREMLERDPAVMRTCVAEAVWRIDGNTPEAVTELIKAIKHGRNQLNMDRCYSARVLGKIGPQASAAIPALEGLLTDKNASVRQAAAEALKTIKAAQEKK